MLAASSSFSETVAGAAIVALFTVAVHRPARATAAVCATSVAALSTYQLLWPDAGVPPVTVFAIIGLGHVATVAWGLSVRQSPGADHVPAGAGGGGRGRGAAAGRAL